MASLDDVSQQVEEVSKAIEISAYEVFPITFDNRAGLKAHLAGFLAGHWLLQAFIPAPDGEGYWAIVHKNVKSTG